MDATPIAEESTNHGSTPTISRPTTPTAAMAIEHTDEQFPTIDSAIKEKYAKKSITTPTSRTLITTSHRSSSKIISLNTYISTQTNTNFACVFRPVIIIFDSLGAIHIPALKALRKYLLDEAKVKIGMDIAGLHAKVDYLPSPPCSLFLPLLHCIFFFV